MRTSISDPEKLETEEGYDFFSVQVIADGKVEQLLGPLSGDVAVAVYEADLSAYAGKKVEIRFTFESDAGVTAPGVAVDDVKIQ